MTTTQHHALEHALTQLQTDLAYIVGESHMSLEQNNRQLMRESLTGISERAKLGCRQIETIYSMLAAAPEEAPLSMSTGG